MSNNPQSHSGNDIESAIEKFVYNTLIGGDISANALPGLSLKSDSKNDPLHEHFVLGFSLGLQKFLEDDASGKDLCQSLSPKGILQNIGLTETWRQGNDALRDMLYEKALCAAEQAIRKLKSLATKSEAIYALKQTLKNFSCHLKKGTITFEYIFDAVKINLKDKQLTSDLFWEVCRETNIPVPNQNLDAIVYVPNGFLVKTDEERESTPKMIVEVVQTGKNPVVFQSNRLPDQKTPWYKSVWAIVAGIILLLTGIWTVIKIYESKTFQEFISHIAHSDSLSEPNNPSDPNALRQ